MKWVTGIVVLLMAFGFLFGTLMIGRRSQDENEK